MLAALGGYEVCYIGHSMGGAVGVLSGDEQIALLVSLAGMVHTRAFAEREFGEEKPEVVPTGLHWFWWVVGVGLLAALIWMWVLR